MKLLILGGEGMTGHVIASYFNQFPNYTVFYTSRSVRDNNSIYLNLPDSMRLKEIIEDKRPDIVINCIEIPPIEAENDPLLAFQMSSLLPNQLTKLIERQHGKLIHLSTDHIFFGNNGEYTEKNS